MEHTVNQITLRGSLQALPQFSHENHGRRFFRFLLEVPRLSGAVDTLPIVTEERVLNAIDLSGGEIENIARKHSVEAILSGNDEIDLDKLIDNCRQERLASPAHVRIGF